MAGGRFSSAQLCFQVEYRTGIARKLESRNTSNSANSSYGVVGILALCAVKPEVYVIRVKLCVSSLAPMNLTQSRPGLNSLACHPTASESWHLYSLGCNFQKSIGRVFAHVPVDSLSFWNRIGQQLFRIYIHSDAIFKKALVAFLHISLSIHCPLGICLWSHWAAAFSPRLMA